MDLQGLKDVTRADVYKNGALAAHLQRSEAGPIEFAYTDEWINNAGPAVATTLPVRLDRVVTMGGAVPPFFAGLPPEVRAQRQATLDAAYAVNPERFTRARPEAPKLPTAAWINEPSQEALIQTA